MAFSLAISLVDRRRCAEKRYPVRLEGEAHVGSSREDSSTDRDRETLALERGSSIRSTKNNSRKIRFRAAVAGTSQSEKLNLHNSLKIVKPYRQNVW